MAVIDLARARAASRDFLLLSRFLQRCCSGARSNTLLWSVAFRGEQWREKNPKLMMRRQHTYSCVSQSRA